MEATTGENAVAEARRQARKEGLGRITVNYVRIIPDTDYVHNPEYTVSQEQQEGPYASTGSSDFHAGEKSDENHTVSLLLCILSSVPCSLDKFWTRLQGRPFMA